MVRVRSHIYMDMAPDRVASHARMQMWDYTTTDFAGKGTKRRSA